MNKLKTEHLQGWEMKLDELENIQDSYTEAFQGIMSAFGITKEDSFILSGCGNTLNGLNYDIAAGFICLEGEVYKVDAHSVVAALTGTDVHQWELEETDDIDSQDFDRNGSGFYKNKIRRAHVVADVPGADHMPMAAETIHDRIAQLSRLSTQKPDWINIPDDTGWNTDDGDEFARYTKNMLGEVEIHLYLEVTVALATIITLPAGYRINMPVTSFFVDANTTVDVLSTGVVRVNTTNSLPSEISCVIKYRADL